MSYNVEDSIVVTPGFLSLGQEDLNSLNVRIEAVFRPLEDLIRSMVQNEPEKMNFTVPSRTPENMDNLPRSYDQTFTRGMYQNHPDPVQQSITTQTGINMIDVPPNLNTDSSAIMKRVKIVTFNRR